MKVLQITLGAIVMAVFAAAAGAGEDGGSSVALTVYNDGNVMVRERRTIDVPRGTGKYRFEEVAATIDPTTVKFRSLDDPEGTAVIEQNYEYDLVSADKILTKYIGKDVQVTTEDGTVYRGTLLSFDREQIVIEGGRRDYPIEIIARADNVKTILCGDLPEGLITKPTLEWVLSSEAGGRQEVEVSYNATQCSWKADYTLLINDEETELDLSGWVTVDNRSGKTYPAARLKLLAGEVHRVEPERRRARLTAEMGRALRERPAFEEKAFSEYHVYTLSKPTTIKDRQTKQIELLVAPGVPFEKKYLFDPLRLYVGYRARMSQPITEVVSVEQKGKVRVYVLLRNDEESNLGMPLPAGRARIFKMDGDDMEFVGEDSVHHTPRNGHVELLMGTAFDIIATRKRTNFQRGRGEKWMEESFEITLRNSRETAVTVYAREHLYRWVNWAVKAASAEYEKIEAQIIEFPVTLEPDEEKKITYTVRYEW